jgi:hypothetical protein
MGMVTRRLRAVAPESIRRHDQDTDQGLLGSSRAGTRRARREEGGPDPIGTGWRRSRLARFLLRPLARGQRPDQGCAGQQGRHGVLPIGPVVKAGKSKEGSADAEDQCQEDGGDTHQQRRYHAPSFELRQRCRRPQPYGARKRLSKRIGSADRGRIAAAGMAGHRGRRRTWPQQALSARSTARPRRLRPWARYR